MYANEQRQQNVSAKDRVQASGSERGREVKKMEKGKTNESGGEGWHGKTMRNVVNAELPLTVATKAQEQKQQEVQQ